MIISENYESYKQYSDSELFSLCKNNDDKNAFDMLYDRYWPEMIEVASRKLQFTQKAEDVVQDVFINLYQKRHSIVFGDTLRGYLFQALKYRILNEFRSELVRSKYQQNKKVPEIVVCKKDFTNELEAKELNEKIQSSINRLPEKCRKVFVLSRCEAKSNNDISEMLQISVSTVEKHIVKALKQVRSDLKYHKILKNGEKQTT